MAAREVARSNATPGGGGAAHFGVRRVSMDSPPAVRNPGSVTHPANPSGLCGESLQYIFVGLVSSLGLFMKHTVRLLKAYMSFVDYSWVSVC